MGVAGTIQGMLGMDHLSIVIECRICGTNVDTESEACPVCGSDEISRYEIE